MGACEPHGQRPQGGTTGNSREAKSGTWGVAGSRGEWDPPSVSRWGWSARAQPGAPAASWPTCSPLFLTHFPDTGSQGGAEVQQRPLSHKVPPHTGHLRGQVTEQAPWGHVPPWVSHDPGMRRLGRGGEQARRGRERRLAPRLPRSKAPRRGRGGKEGAGPQAPSSGAAGAAPPPRAWGTELPVSESVQTGGEEPGVRRRKNAAQGLPAQAGGLTGRERTGLEGCCHVPKVAKAHPSPQLVLQRQAGCRAWSWTGRNPCGFPRKAGSRKGAPARSTSPSPQASSRCQERGSSPGPGVWDPSPEPPGPASNPGPASGGLIQGILS